MTDKNFQFVVTSDPQQSRQQLNRRIVRSSAARHGWSKSAPQRDAKRRSGKEKSTRTLVAGDRRSTNVPASEGEEQCQEHHRIGPIVGILGAGRVDPFRSYPAPHQPIFPELVDYYVTVMAIDVPELDVAENSGLLKTRWFPFVLQSQCTFMVVMLLAAAHLSSQQSRPEVLVNLLKLKQNAIQSINSSLGDKEQQSNDWVIGSVAKMASYEAIFGDIESYRVHMSGLRQMVTMRGGLDSLGLHGFLRRMVIWIDINSGYLKGVARVFPKAKLYHGDRIAEPNLARFGVILDPVSYN